jgi:flavodoxin
MLRRALGAFGQQADQASGLFASSRVVDLPDRQTVKQSDKSQRVAIVYASVHHGNTRLVAETLADELSADLYTVANAHKLDPAAYDLLGVGSGIYFARHHSSILQFAKSWSRPANRVFLFSTAGLPFLRKFQHAALRTLLRSNGCEIVGEFCCRGWDTAGPLWLIGGINRHRPNARDLVRARQFALEISSSCRRVHHGG